MGDAYSVIPEPVSLDTREDQHPTISIDTGGRTGPIAAPLAASKAEKAHYGIGPIMGLDYEELYNRILNGGDKDLRNEVAANLDVNIAKDKIDRVRSLGSGVTADALNQILAPTPKTDPNFVFEGAHAHRYMSNLEQGDYSDWDTAKKVIPEYVGNTMQMSVEYQTKSSWIANKLQEAEQAVEEQGWGSWGLDFLKSSVNFYSQLKLTGKIGLFGQNLEDAAMKYLTMPLSDFREQAPKDIDKLIRDNPQEAVRFLRAMYGQSTSDKFLNSVMGGLDFALIPGITKVPGLMSRASLFNYTRKAARDMLSSQALKEPPAVAAARGAGDTLGAASAKAADAIQKDLKGIPSLDKEMGTLTSHFKTIASEIEAGKGNTSREALTRMLDTYQAMPSKLIDIIVNAARTERTSIAQASEDQIKKVLDTVQSRVPYYKDGALDVTLHQHPVLGSWTAHLHMGNSKGELFATEEKARISAVGRGYPEATIVEQEGKKFKWLLPIPIRETDPIIRQLNKLVPDAVSPHNWLNSAIGWLRSPNETLATQQIQNRIAATYAPNTFLEFAREHMQEIVDITGFRNKKRFKDFEQLVRAGQQTFDEDGAKLGKWFKSPAEIEDWYLRNLQRMPDASEVSAYFAFRRIVEMDRVLRQIMVNRNKARLGAENHRVFNFDGKGNRVDSPYFDGTRVYEWPSGDGSVLIVNNKTGDHIKTKMSIALRNRYEEPLRTGRIKVLRVFNPYLRELSGYAGSDSPFRFVITDSLQTRPLRWDSLPSRGGGHFDYTFDRSLRQAKIRYDGLTKMNHYEGDNTLWLESVRGGGPNFAKNINEVNALIRDNKLDQARDLFNKRIADMSWEDYYKETQPQRIDPQTIIPPRINIHEPVHVVPRGKSVIDVDSELRSRHKNFVDGTRSYSDANQSIVEFTGERNSHELLSVGDVGSKDNPIFKFEAAPMMDALPMMDRGLNRLIQSYFIDDIKMSAIEHWVTEAMPHLKDDIARSAERASFRVFNEASEASFKRTDPIAVRNLMGNKMKIDQFIGTPSKYDTFLHATAQKLADSVYTKAGPKWSIVPSKALPFVRDPFRFMRSVAFNEYVGLFSIPQFLVHLTTYSTVLGVAGPQKAIPGTYAAFLHGLATINPRMVDMLDQKAAHSVMNFMPGSKWKLGEFKESYNLAQTTGFLKAESEHGMLDSIWNNKIVSTGIYKFLDWGRIFFKKGLQSVRTAAWHTAYREFRDANPTAVISNVERNQILARADLLAHSMSRASSSFINHGAFSTTTQFYMYQQRLFEMMTPFVGKQLTTAEKTRLFATNMVLFGFPTAASLYGPLHSYFREKAMEYGYEPQENAISSLFWEGGLAMLGALASGEGDWKKGTLMAVGERYGTKGPEWMLGPTRTDASLLDWVGGAAYQNLKNTAWDLDGFYRAMTSGAKTVMGIEHENEVYPMTVDTLIQPLKNISSVNNFDRTIQAINTGKWFSRRGQWLDDASVSEALLGAVTGLQKVSTADIHPMSEVRKSEKERMESTRKEFFEVMHRYYQAMENDDYDQAKQYFQQGQSILITNGYPEEDVLKLYGQAANNNIPFYQKIKWDYYNKDVPTYRKGTADQARETYEKIQRNKGKEPW